MSFSSGLNKTASGLGDMINQNISKATAPKLPKPPTPPPAPVSNTGVMNNMGKAFGSIRRAFGGA